MNPSLIFTLFSFRKELATVFTVFLVIISLPIFAVIILTKTGINFVSDKLAVFDTVTNRVVLFNPKDGSIYQTLSETFTWPAQGIITLEFGKSSLFQLFHTGIDIANPYGRIGSPVTVFMPGKVIYTGTLSWGYGKHIIVDHGTNITSLYAHLNTINVEKGQEVKPGEIIGTEGKTGWTTGTHLHFETRVFGIPVNPRVFLGYLNNT